MFSYNKYINQNKIMTLIQHLGMFMLGLRDSVSFEWIKKTLLYVDPQTKKIHPSSKRLFDSLKSSLIKVSLYVIIVPLILEYLDFYSISSVFKFVYLILTYGYLFFYNNDILVSTRKLAAWQQKRTPGSNVELDRVQKIQFFTQLSGQVKGFIFLLFYYVPIFLIQTKILTYIPYLGMFCLLASQSFFNGVFYFMKTWPFDQYNIGFMQENMSYMMGYGLVVSIVCNYVLTGSFATGAYFILSLWMLINSVIYSPPQVQFTSFAQILKIFTNQGLRKELKNAYNQHRTKIRKDEKYRQKIVKQIFVVYPALKITQILNSKISKLMQNNKNIPECERHQVQNGIKTEQQTKESSFVNSSGYSNTIPEQDEQKQQQMNQNKSLLSKDQHKD